MKYKDKKIFKTFVFPHICYLADTTNRETPYKLFMVTKDNNDKYVRFEYNESNWK